MPTLRQWGIYPDDAALRRHRGMDLRGLPKDRQKRGLGAMTTDNRTNEPTDDRETVTKFPAIILDRAFIRWRNVEIDRTGTLPEGFEMFRAGWNRAVAAMKGEHDHIEDGNSYLDCGACEMERKER